MVITGKSLMWLVIAAVAAVLLGSWLLWNRETPEAKVKAAIREMASCVTKPAGMKTSAELLKVHTFTGLFAPHCRLALHHAMATGEFTPEELGSNLVRFFNMVNRARGAVEEIEVTLHGPDRAAAEFTGILEGEDRSGATFEERRELRTELVLDEEGHWRIASVVIRDLLER